MRLETDLRMDFFILHDIVKVQDLDGSTILIEWGYGLF